MSRLATPLDAPVSVKAGEAAVVWVHGDFACLSEDAVLVSDWGDVAILTETFRATERSQEHRESLKVVLA